MSEEIQFRRLPPVWFIRFLNGFRRLLRGISDKLFPASLVLYEKFQHLWLLPCIKVAAQLNIAGILKDGPLEMVEIAGRVNAHPEALNRMMRALASQGIFRQRKDGRFENTSLSRALMDGKNSLRYVLLHHLGNLNWNGLSELIYSVRTGEDAFSMIHGKPIYDYLPEHSGESGIFDKSMTELTKLGLEPLLSAYDFSAFTTVADIGGGEGLLLSSILFKHKHLKGILFDLPEGLRNASVTIGKFNVSERIRVTEGSFFNDIPPGAEAYVLKNILHNWGDEECIKILSNIRDVLPPNGKILIIDMVIDEDNRPSFGKLIDIQMLVFMHSGKERTQKEFRDILGRSGLKISRIVPTIAPISIIEITRP